MDTNPAGYTVPPETSDYGNHAQIFEGLSDFCKSETLNLLEISNYLTDEMEGLPLEFFAGDHGFPIIAEEYGVRALSHEAAGKVHYFAIEVLMLVAKGDDEFGTSRFFNNAIRIDLDSGEIAYLKETDVTTEMKPF